MSETFMTTLLGLTGVVLGAAVAFIGQLTASRSRLHRLRLEEASRSRAEGRRAVSDFLRSVQAVEAILDGRTTDVGVTDADLRSAMNDLWLSQKIVYMSSPSPIPELSEQLGSALHVAAWERGHDEWWHVVAEARRPFLDAIKNSLGPGPSELHR